MGQSESVGQSEGVAAADHAPLGRTDPESGRGAVPFAVAPYDRAAHRRGEGWWGRESADPRTRVVVVGDDEVATAEQGLRLLAAAEADTLVSNADGPAERFLLGEADTGPVLAVALPRLPERLQPQPVRTVAPGLQPLQGSLLVHALGLANWHRTHLFCARCGGPTRAELAGHVRRCERCDAQHFPRTDPAVIMLVTDDDDRALLGHAPQWPEGRYSTLAGFVEPGESLEDAVRREVGEETGVGVGEVRYAASQPWPFPSSLMLGFFARASSTRIRVDGDEVSSARWFSRDDVHAAAASGRMLLPGEFSISRWLVTTWAGRRLPGRW